MKEIRNAGAQMTFRGREKVYTAKLIVKAGQRYSKRTFRTPSAAAGYTAGWERRYRQLFVKSED